MALPILPRPDGWRPAPWTATVALAASLAAALAACGTRPHPPPAGAGAPPASTRFDAAGAELGPEQVAELASRAPTVRHVVLRDARGVNTAVVEMLAAAPHLESLDLGYTEVGDADLPRLSTIATLRTLHLVGTATSDEGARHLARLMRLSHLNLGETRITNATLDALGGLPELETLHIGGSGVDERGLAVIADAFPKLRLLRVSGLSISPAAIDTLRRRRPALEVE